ncbi:hypothetical protein B484DRAFT_391085, partial [Ochromonadaceae sp. CCMP2298]
AQGLGEFSTVGGLLCAVAGRIPKAGDRVPFRNFLYTVKEVEDNRLILSISAAPLGDRGEGGDVDSSREEQEEADTDPEEFPASNRDPEKKIKREPGNRKRENGYSQTGLNGIVESAFAAAPDVLSAMGE